MFKLIEKLRQKPEGTQRVVAFSTALLFSGTIFLVWLTVIYPDLIGQKQKEEKVVTSEPSAFSAFFSVLSKGASDMGKNISQIKELTASVTSSLYQDNSHYVSTSTATSTIDSSSNLQFVNENSTSTNEMASSTENSSL